MFVRAQGIFAITPSLLVCVLFNGCAGISSQTQDPPIPSGKIQHVIIVFQENRTPDNLFHRFPNADIANYGLNSRGKLIPLTASSLRTPYDLAHSHVAFLSMFDRGKMDGADKVSCNPSRKCPPHAQFKYVNPSEVQPYFEIANRYTFGDRMFQTNQGPSFPAHQFILSGTSAPEANSDSFAAENISNKLGAPQGITFSDSGCGAPVGDVVAIINPLGREDYLISPCFEHPTLPDSLDTKNLPWRYYSTLGWWNSLWNAPAAIRHLRTGPDWANVIPRPTDVLTDISNGTLPAVSWVIPNGESSDHAGANNGTGPSWVAAVVNAIGNSQYWPNTAIFITWDDWGGWYDHVAPLIYDQYEYGFRVPLIVVSPYAKQHYVSHIVHDFGSVLRFIEENFELPSLGYADSRADDLSDCFNFNQVPSQFRSIAAPLDEQAFIHDHTPPTAPDTD